MSKHEAAVGIANHLIKSSSDQMVKGLARGFLELMNDNAELSKTIAELTLLINIQNTRDVGLNESLQ